MTNRTGYETDVAAITELFDEDVPTADLILRDYLRPRAKRMATGSRENRDHFWKVPLFADETMSGAMVSAGLLVKNELSELEKPEFAGHFVGKAVAAIFCGCSESELDRRIRSPQTGGLQTLEALMETRLVGDRREFRMSRVKELKKIRVPASEGRAKTKADPVVHEKPAAPLPVSMRPTVTVSARAEVSKNKASVTLEMALTDETLWVENKDGETLAHLLIGALKSGALAKVLTDGGTIASRTLQAALFRPWASAEAREPWAKGYSVLLVREAAALDVANSVAVDRELSILTPPMASSTPEGKRL